MSETDRKIRMVLGCIFLSLGLTDVVVADPMSSVLISIVGTVALLSGLLRYCVLYEFTGLATYLPADDDTNSQG